MREALFALVLLRCTEAGGDGRGDAEEKKEREEQEEREQREQRDGQWPHVKGIFAGGFTLILGHTPSYSILLAACMRAVCGGGTGLKDEFMAGSIAGVLASWWGCGFGLEMLANIVVGAMFFLVYKCKLEGEITMLRTVNNLMTAARRGDTELVQELIRAGADLDAKDENGRTALFWACEAGSPIKIMEIMKQLIRAGANLDVQDNNGMTVLMGYAKVSASNLTSAAVGDCYFKSDIIQQLIRAGATTTIRDHHGKTALDYAPESATETKTILRCANAEEKATKAEEERILRREMKGIKRTTIGLSEMKHREVVRHRQEMKQE